MRAFGIDQFRYSTAAAFRLDNTLMSRTGGGGCPSGFCFFPPTVGIFAVP
ncbi:hypothetical protein AB4305_26730 [Nocardia sp. 2YAB30]